MKTLKRIAVALLVLVILIAASAFILIRHISHRAIPDYNKNLSLDGLLAAVDVYRDSLAIPHVYASNEHDLYLATGYILAEDRLWQMDLLRRVTEGRLSEIFGEKYVDTDLLLRALRFSKKSEKILEGTTPESKQALLAFADGINQYIRKNIHRLPPEFAILGYRPELWTPIQSLNMIGYMAWDLKAGWSEIILRDIQKQVDSVRFKQILPNLNRPQPVVYGLYKQLDKEALVLPDLLLNNLRLRELGTDVLEGSNNWAVSGAKSNTGMPLLANDMHLGLSIPGIWYQIHQVVPGQLNVTGVLLPGAPMIICGHNDSIAWGMTNTYVDNLDFYQEKINPADSDQYAFNGSWKNFDIQKTEIPVKGKKPVERILRFSRHGAIVSSFKKIKGAVISMHWVGDEPSDEFRSVLMLDHARNWHDFLNALRTFTSISQNVVYADKKGNIGLFCAAGVPIRNRDIPFGILPGDTDTYDWKGYVPFEKLPYLFNPASGFVASANNRTAPPDYPYHIGSWYALPSRFDRITELLSQKPVLSVADFKVIQLDQHSSLAKKYMPVFLHALEGETGLNSTETKALDLLKSWDYSMAGKSGTPALFEALYLHLIRCTFADELGPLFEGFNGTTSVSRNALDQLINQPNSPWFDDVNTPKKVENMQDMIRCAFHDAVSELQHKMGNDPASWQWERIHHLVLAHPLASVKILDRIFHLNRGPYPVGGSWHTVSPYSYDPDKPYDSDHGSSHRHIFDIKDWNRSLTVIPTGESGIPASPYYCNQTQFYLQGIYHHDYFSKEKVIASARYHMQFMPKP